ncbi:MAG: hypothetical protein K2N81_06670 [Acetatifactor sp.]|nr:hypothetical protein [Acetatifactor sp.]
MGRGSYQSQDWDRLRSARNINSQSTVQDLYQSRSMKDHLNPHGVKYRESCDSMDNPASTAIIFGLDVTGSMGYLSEEIAKGALNRTMLEIYDKTPVTNPHIMFQAIGDSKSDSAPLQITQFEADIRIAEQLLDVYFEGRGGGNGGESYLLSWYFAARHTKIDCYDKRHEKGFLFTIGDERCHETLSAEEILRVFGDTPASQNTSKVPFVEDIKNLFDSGVNRTSAAGQCTAKELFAEASEKYEIFHIVMKAGSYKYQKSGEGWRSLIGNRAVELDPEDLDVLPELFVSLMQYARSGDAKTITAQWKGKAADVIKRILDDMGPLSEKDAEKSFLKF